MSKEKFGMGLVLGAAAGFAAAYLFAPKSGDELQEDIVVKRKDATRKTILAADNAVTSAEVWLDKQIDKQQDKTKKFAAARSQNKAMRDDYDVVAVKPKEDVVIEKYRNL